jgi:hypothetical protein
MTPLKFKRMIMGYIVIVGMLCMMSFAGMSWVSISKNDVTIVSQTEKIPAFARMMEIRKY